MSRGSFRHVLLFILLAIGCSGPDTSGVRMIGHGGQGVNGPHPMNGREALLGGLADGAYGIEMDVQLTADGVLVAYHEQALRGSGTCTGLVNSHPWSEIAHCGPNGAPLVRVDSLIAEALSLYPEAEFTLDVKLFAAGEWSSYIEDVAEAIAELARAGSLRKPLLVECQVDEFLLRMGERSKAVQRYYYATDAGEGIVKAKELGCAGLTIAYDLIDEQQAAELRAFGLNLTLFGVSGNRSLGKALRLEPDRIQTDITPDH